MFFIFKYALRHWPVWVLLNHQYLALNLSPLCVLKGKMSKLSLQDLCNALVKCKSIKSRQCNWVLLEQTQQWRAMSVNYYHLPILRETDRILKKPKFPTITRCQNIICNFICFLKTGVFCYIFVAIILETLLPFMPTNIL